MSIEKIRSASGRSSTSAFRPQTLTAKSARKRSISWSVNAVVSTPEAKIRGLSKYITQQVERRLGEDDLNPGAVILATEITLPNVKGQALKVEVYVATVRSSKIVAGGGAGKNTRSGQPAISISVGVGRPELLRAALQRGAFEKDLHDVVMHELTHAADILGDDEGGEERGVLDTPEEDDFKTYYNRPGEVRASMGEIARRVVEGMREYVEAGMTPKEAFEGALADDERWADMEPHLTPANRQHILKAVWTAATDAGLI